MKLKESDLKTIKENEREVNNCFRSMISLWLRQVSPNHAASWAAIVEALKAPPVNHSKLAVRIEKEQLFSVQEKSLCAAVGTKLTGNSLRIW